MLSKTSLRAKNWTFVNSLSLTFIPIWSCLNNTVLSLRWNWERLQLSLLHYHLTERTRVTDWPQIDLRRVKLSSISDRKYLKTYSTRIISSHFLVQFHTLLSGRCLERTRSLTSKVVTRKFSFNSHHKIQTSCLLGKYYPVRRPIWARYTCLTLSASSIRGNKIFQN